MLNFSVDRRIDFILHMKKLAAKTQGMTLFYPELESAEIGICNDIHNNVRNKVSHVSMPPESRCRELVNKFHPKLTKLLQSLTSLKDYKLAQVSALSVKSGRYQHTIVSMMGNNSLYQSQIEDLDNAIPADTGHVILIDQEYNILDLHPFFVMYAWESTGMHQHLCFFKQIEGKHPNQHLRVESTQGVGDTATDTDMDLNSILT